eukprot:34925-Eustigmatos_ZCMA.PRE.1
MLQLDYQKRITVEKALEHPYFANVRDTAMEFVTDSPVPWGQIETCPLTRGALQVQFSAYDQQQPWLALRRP